MPPKRSMRFLLTGLLLAGSPSSARAAMLALSPDADTYLRDATARGALSFMDVRGGGVDFRGYLRFDLSEIPLGSSIDAATLRLFQVTGASRNDAITAERFAAYGSSDAPGNTPQDWDEATFVPSLQGAEDVTTLSGVVDLDGDVTGITETLEGTFPDTVVSVTGAPLASFLQTRLDDGGLATFILSNDDLADRGFGFGTKEGADPNAVSVLEIEYTVPEPAGAALLASAIAGIGGLRWLARPRRS